ncbi:hypothetical protein PAMP_015289 [Pampus punctatissimus]
MHQHSLKEEQRRRARLQIGERIQRLSLDLVVVLVVVMERFLALLRLLGRRRRGRRYRADDDYQEGYEDVYYYTSKYNTHLLSE